MICLLQTTVHQSFPLPYRWRVLCVVAPAASADADLRQRTRPSESKDEECDFAKRTHLSHVKSGICVFQGWRKQRGSGDISMQKSWRNPTWKPTTSAAAAAPLGRQNFMIPRAKNQLHGSRPGSVFIYGCVGGTAN